MTDETFEYNDHDYKIGVTSDGKQFAIDEDGRVSRYAPFTMNEDYDGSILSTPFNSPILESTGVIAKKVETYTPNINELSNFKGIVDGYVFANSMVAYDNIHNFEETLKELEDMEIELEDEELEFIDNPNAKDPNAKDPNAKDPDPKDPNAKDPDPKDPNAKDPNAKDPNAKDPNAKDPDPKDPNAKDPVDPCKNSPHCEKVKIDGVTRYIPCPSSDINAVKGCLDYGTPGTNAVSVINQNLINPEVLEKDIKTTKINQGYVNVEYDLDQKIVVQVVQSAWDGTNPNNDYYEKEYVYTYNPKTKSYEYETDSGDIIEYNFEIDSNNKPHFVSKDGDRLSFFDAEIVNAKKAYDDGLSVGSKFAGVGGVAKVEDLLKTKTSSQTNAADKGIELKKPTIEDNVNNYYDAQIPGSRIDIYGINAYSPGEEGWYQGTIDKGVGTTVDKAFKFETKDYMILKVNDKWVYRDAGATIYLSEDEVKLTDSQQRAFDALYEKYEAIN